ncbi:MAG: hypothetical protein P8Y49_02560 [Sulfurovaceae bacterium]
MAGLIMLGLIALMVLTLIVMLFLRQGWKRILVTFVGFVVVIGLFNSYVMKTCLPNAKDVEIMTPQAEVITNYILKNGIPKSLAEIPDLPYRLVDCKWTEKNVEWCYFDVDENRYSIRTYIVSGNYNTYIYMKIYDEKSETGIFTEIDKKSNNNRFEIIDSCKPYSTKNDGVCNPMRQ